METVKPIPSEKIVDFKDWSLEQKVGQLVMPALTGLSLTEMERNGLEQGIMGGVLLLDRNVKDEAQLKNLTATLRQANQNILIAVDQEGGRASRLPWVDNTPQVEITTEGNALKVAQTRGGQLRKLGIGVNLAPVVEKAVEPQSYVAQQNRAFTKDNGLLATAMVKGYLEAGIVPVVKHFPGGLGRVSDDPHLTLPMVNINQPQLEQDLEPFKQVISAGVPAIMVTHLLYPEIDKNPVSSSRIFLGDILRGRLNFTGVIVVDDLSMGAVKNNFEVGEYAIESIKAGADLLLVSDQLDYRKVVEGLKAAVESGRLLEARIEESIKRVSEIRDKE